MPTPLDLLLDPVMLTVMGMYLLLMIWEALFPARKLPHIRFWKLKGIAAFILYVLLSTYVPYGYASLLPKAQLFDLSQQPVYLSATAAVLLFELGVYVWHRTMHHSNLLWRVMHQMHHSAERLDTYGAFFFSPMDTIGFTLLGTLCFSVILGLQPQAVTIMLLVTNFLAIFQHANIKTPVWLGYIIQRPESHSVHHSRGVHAYNYSDLPLYDLLFGSFRNPKDFEAEAGFYHGASERITDMLMFRDLNATGNEPDLQILTK
jgi:sterol desaturase/sphingolipid hydroxylase (fatty acid hydroxylase superfamily)